MLEKSYLANGGTTLPFVMLRAVHGTENTIFWCWTVTPKRKSQIRVLLPVKSQIEGSIIQYTIQCKMGA